MNLNKKERKLKMYIAAQKELNLLYTQKYSLPSIPLPEPIRHGWKRFFVLREDIAVSRFAEDMQQILKHINQIVFSRRRDFMRRMGRSKVWEPIPHGLRSIGVAEWDRKKIPEHLKKYFSRCDIFCSECTPQWHESRYHFKHPYWFVSVTKRHYLTHYTEPDPALESRIAKLQKFLEGEGWATLARHHGYRHRFEPGYDDTKLHITEQQAKRELKNYEDE